MLPLHTRLKQPTATLWYQALPNICIALIIFVIGQVVTVFINQSADSLCVGGSCIVSPVLTGLVVIVVCFLIIAEPIVRFFLFSYELSESSITINTGIIFRQYETIDFGRIQVVDSERGPLLWVFGLTETNIWTASMDQLNAHAGSHARVSARPDARLVLHRDTAQQLKDFMLRLKKPAAL